MYKKKLSRVQITLTCPPFLEHWIWEILAILALASATIQNHEITLLSQLLVVSGMNETTSQNVDEKNFAEWTNLNMWRDDLSAEASWTDININSSIE